MISDGPLNIVHSDFYIKSGSGPHIMRNIFENVEYDEYEKDCIIKLKQALMQSSIKLNIKQSVLLKMLIVAQYDIQKAVENCINHIKFLKEYSEMDLTKELKQGSIYTCGFDKQFRPVIIINRFISIKLIAYFLETVKRYLLIDYYVENWTVILDLDKDLPSLDLEDLQYLELHFCGNLNKFLIVNGPEDIAEIAKVFTDKLPFLKNKVRIIEELEELQQFIPADQLEIQYGGDMAKVEIFWPIPRRDNISLYIPKTSHLSIGSLDKSPRKASFMKITVLEENGNALHDEQVEVYEEEEGQFGNQENKSMKSKSLKSRTVQSKSIQSSTSQNKFQQKQQQYQNDEFNDISQDVIPQDEVFENKNNLKQSCTKFRETKTTVYTHKQTVLEGENQLGSSLNCSCSKSCLIF